LNQGVAKNPEEDEDLEEEKDVPGTYNPSEFSNL